MKDLINDMLECQACPLRKGCLQVVPPLGAFDNPLLMIVGEAPSQQDDEAGEGFLGSIGQLLRETLRNTKIINRKNSVLTNIVKCRPPKNQFPKNDTPSICVSKWLSKEIELLKPKRILLLGATPLKYVAKLDGITKLRGQWITAYGIRTMSTFHPSYVLRSDREGMKCHRETFERDIMEVAEEIGKIQNQTERG